MQQPRHRGIVNALPSTRVLGRPSRGLHWELLGNPLGTFRKSHTHALIQPNEQSIPSSCKHWWFIGWNSSSIERFFRAARKVSQTVGWDDVNERLECGLLRKPHPPATAPQWHGCSKARGGRRGVKGRAGLELELLLPLGPRLFRFSSAQPGRRLLL